MARTDDPAHDARDLDPRFTRTRLLQGAAGAGLALTAGGLLVPAVSGAASAREQIKRGGLLRVGHSGAGKNETFNPARGSSFIDTSRQYNVFDPLVRVNPDLKVAPGLALSWTPNKTSSVWEVKLRP